MDASEALPTPTDVAMVDIASTDAVAIPLEQPVLFEPGELRLNTDNEQRASVPDSQPTMGTTADAANAEDVVTVSGTEAPKISDSSSVFPQCACESTLPIYGEVFNV
ncbi:uncharacterized protein PHALS_07378 [Plasmopara halstedii]|uniref:Uncharacterized protein n=1 Tax=Plasmopara halstedii TaxID=4781 RepID=A0A0P1B553_PLAHL|nr:uncharacterized protein PHALS_07378 [Plasmopara halstedii]CEG49625.1 hypothetical protein PHALS_07378 [Plasmopara halstedii]|eukprot:XP_024585994.1 hypothetical protein PHALS_07378 [Plasmopara halstedii]